MNKIFSNDDDDMGNYMTIVFHTKTCGCRDSIRAVGAKRERDDHYSVQIGPDCRSIRCPNKYILGNGSVYWHTRCEISDVPDTGIVILQDTVDVPDAGVLLIKVMKGEAALIASVALLVDAFILADFYAYEGGIETTRDLLECWARSILAMVRPRGWLLQPKPHNQMSNITLERVASMSHGLYNKLGELFQTRFAEELSWAFVEKELGVDIFEALPSDDVCLKVISKQYFNEYDVAFVPRCKIAIKACYDTDILSSLNHMLTEDYTDATDAENIIKDAISERIGSLLGSFSSILREGPDSTKLESIMRLDYTAMKMLLRHRDGRIESENCVAEMMRRYMLSNKSEELIYNDVISQYICKKSISPTVLVNFVTSSEFPDDGYADIRGDFVEAMTQRLKGNNDVVSHYIKKINYAKIARMDATLSFQSADLVDDDLNPPAYDDVGRSMREATSVPTVYLHGFRFKLFIMRKMHQSKFEAHLRLVSPLLSDGRRLPMRIKVMTPASAEPVESTDFVSSDKYDGTLMMYRGNVHVDEGVTIEIVGIDDVEVICNE